MICVNGWCQALRSVNRREKLGLTRHGELGRMVGQPATVARAADRLGWLGQARLSCLFRVPHDLGRPVVSAGAVAGLALDSGKSGTRGVATKAPARRLMVREELGCPAVGGVRPTLIDGAMAESAPLDADVGGLEGLQLPERGNNQQPGRCHRCIAHSPRSQPLSTNPRQPSRESVDQRRTERCLRPDSRAERKASNGSGEEAEHAQG